MKKSKALRNAINWLNTAECDDIELMDALFDLYYEARSKEDMDEYVNKRNQNAAESV